MNPEDPMLKDRILCNGATISTGAAVGVLVFSVQEALVCCAAHQPCILLCRDMYSDENSDGLTVFQVFIAARTL